MFFSFSPSSEQRLHRVSSTVNTCRTASKLAAHGEAEELILQRSYFKAPVIFLSLATILQRCHGYIKGFPAVTVGKKRLYPWQWACWENKGGIKTLAVLFDAAKTAAELHPMTRYFHSHLFSANFCTATSERKLAVLTLGPTEEHRASHHAMKEDLWRAVSGRSLQGQRLSMRFQVGSGLDLSSISFHSA